MKKVLIFLLFALGVQVASAQNDKPLSLRACSGDVEAQIEMGDAYLRGEGVAQNYKEAIYWYNLAARQSNLVAYIKLANCYAHGFGTALNTKKALNLCYKGKECDDALLHQEEQLTKQALLGDMKAQYQIGEAYRLGKGYKKSTDKAIFWYELAAKQECVLAQRQAGHCYRTKGVKYAKSAAYWFRRGAEQGCMDCQNELGKCYEDPFGVKQDYWQAVHWYRKSAEQGCAAAQYNLGRCYADGIGVKKDPTTAVYWYENSAVQGYASAECNLGWCYENGFGVDQDAHKAIYLYQQAARHGDAIGQYNFASCLAERSNYKEALPWYRKSAKQGYANAMLALANCYWYGRGVPYDYGKYKYWFNLYKRNK